MKESINVLTLLLQKIKQILEKMLEERKIYLKHHPETKGNAYYVWSPQLPYRKIADIRVPWSRDGGFKSQLLLHRRCSVEETQELVRALLLVGVPTRKIGEVLKKLYGMQLSPTTASCLAQIAQQEITAWRERS